MEKNPVGSEEPNNFWHHLTGEAAIAALNTDQENGLSSSEVAARTSKYGLNELKEALSPPRSISRNSITNRS